MEAREGMIKIKEYESEQNEIYQKVKENREKKISEILNYNGMLNQKRKENLEQKKMADKALSQQLDQAFNNLNHRVEVAANNHDDVLNDRKRGI